MSGVDFAEEEEKITMILPAENEEKGGYEQNEDSMCGETERDQLS